MYICSQCGEEKPIDEFYVYQRRYSACKVCRRRRVTQSAEQNAEEARQRRAADLNIQQHYLEAPLDFIHRGEWPANEHWRPIPEYVGRYEASDQGRIRSLVTVKSVWKWRKVPLVLHHYSNKDGYQTVTLVDGLGKHSTQHVHRLVLLAFSGSPPKGHIAGHRDGNPSNNKLSNLRWITYLQNEEDKRQHGRSLTGSRNHQAKLNEETVRQLRADRTANSLSYRKLAVKYGISIPVVQKIVAGRAWKHVL